MRALHFIPLLMALFVLVASLGACTQGQRTGVGLFMGALTTAQAVQCGKDEAEREREWEATGRSVEPIDCDGDGYPDFGPNAKPD